MPTAVTIAARRLSQTVVLKSTEDTVPGALGRFVMLSGRSILVCFRCFSGL